ncbi:MAG: hypothetical protein OYH77_07855 [Pseudomonadota bacterium]|nr:hypothetical protein [Pseudomonadota bacterium]
MGSVVYIVNTIAAKVALELIALPTTVRVIALLFARPLVLYSSIATLASSNAMILGRLLAPIQTPHA